MGKALGQPGSGQRKARGKLGTAETGVGGGRAPSIPSTFTGELTGDAESANG